MSRSFLTDVLLDLFLEPLVMSVGHWVLGLLGVKPFASPRWDSFVAGAVGIAVWIVVGVLIGLVVS